MLLRELLDKFITFSIPKFVLGTGHQIRSNIHCLGCNSCRLKAGSHRDQKSLFFQWAWTRHDAETE